MKRFFFSVKNLWKVKMPQKKFVERNIFFIKIFVDRNIFP